MVASTLRHTFASWLALQGTSLYEIKELMEHKSIKMTERYAHLMPNVKIKAVNKLETNGVRSTHFTKEGLFPIILSSLPAFFIFGLHSLTAAPPLIVSRNFGHTGSIQI
jgi:hypothetical protein